MKKIAFLRFGASTMAPTQTEGVEILDWPMFHLAQVEEIAPLLPAESPDGIVLTYPFRRGDGKFGKVGSIMDVFEPAELLMPFRTAAGSLQNAFVVWGEMRLYDAMKRAFDILTTAYPKTQIAVCIGVDRMLIPIMHQEMNGSRHKLNPRKAFKACEDCIATGLTTLKDELRQLVVVQMPTLAPTGPRLLHLTTMPSPRKMPDMEKESPFTVFLPASSNVATLELTVLTFIGMWKKYGTKSPIILVTCFQYMRPALEDYIPKHLLEKIGALIRFDEV